MKDIAVDKIRDYFEDLLRDKKTLIKILFVILILLIAGILRLSGESDPSVSIDRANDTGIEVEEASEDHSGSAEICVDIGGQVVNPGVYQVSEGTRLFQLIEMAGGLTENADTDTINRASYVEDGEKILIPSKASSSSVGTGSGALTGETDVSVGISPGGLVNINLASKEELKTLNGIGDVTAEKIIEYRKENRFKKKEDIKSVKGIGDAIFDKIKDSITC